MPEVRKIIFSATNSSFISGFLREAAKKSSTNGRAIQRGGGGEGWAIKGKKNFL